MDRQNWLDSAAHARWLEGATDDLLEFGRAAATPTGFGWLGDDGQLMDRESSYLWLTGRMSYVFTLGYLLGRPGARDLAEHGIRSLLTRFADPEHGGWWAHVTEGGPVDRRKEAYQHSFVLLAGASAVVAGIDEGHELLDRAIEVVDQHFWDEDAAMMRESWDEAFREEEDYRGANANMHSVEAFLAAADATQDARWLDRALVVTDRLLNVHAREFGWRLPEHFTAGWEPVPSYNADAPAHPFRPYGATIGHWMEWSRLAVTLDGALRAWRRPSPDWLVPAARSLFAAAIDAWAIDGAPGFVYTVDWDGSPVVTERMHWVVTEAIGAAAALYRLDEDPSYERWYARFWDHARATFITAPGSWCHEFDARFRPSERVWKGRPDIYHAVQATLVPRVNATSGLASALARGDIR